MSDNEATTDAQKLAAIREIWDKYFEPEPLYLPVNNTRAIGAILDEPSAEPTEEDVMEYLGKEIRKHSLQNDETLLGLWSLVDSREKKGDKLTPNKDIYTLLSGASEPLGIEADIYHAGNHYVIYFIHDDLAPENFKALTGLSLKKGESITRRMVLLEIPEGEGDDD